MLKGRGDDQSVILCLRVEGNPRHIYPGSVQMECKDCGTKIWVAPSGKELIEKENAIPVCIVCGQARMDVGHGELMITEKARQEIKAWLRRH